MCKMNTWKYDWRDLHGRRGTSGVKINEGKKKINDKEKFKYIF
jgi:hypothetical protein